MADGFDILGSNNPNREDYIGIISSLISRIDYLESIVQEQMDDFGEPEGGGGGGGEDFEVVGTPALFKVVSLTGWTLSESGTWTQMSTGDMVATPPTTLYSGETEAGNYLRPTWDYVRAH